MKLEKLSEIYFSSTSNIQKEATELYESLHLHRGDPQTNWEVVLELVRKFKQTINVEVDTVTTACEEYNEQLEGRA